MKKTFTYFYKRAARIALIVCALVIGGASAEWADAKSLPYSYDLESTALDDEGWTSYNLYNGGSSYNVSQRYNSSSYAHSSSYSFRFYGASSTTQYLISPEIETSTTGITVSFYCYAAATSAAQTRTFSVGYSTTGATYSSFSNYTDYSVTFDKSSTAEWKLITTNIDATDAKYVVIKYTSSGTSYFDDFSFVKQTAYKTPTSFALDSYDATSATFSWTAGNSETTWQFDYSTDSDFTPGSGINGTSASITTNPYTLSKLTTGTTYYAAIRADYGDSNYSEWTDKIEFTPNNEVVSTINDGTTTIYNLPFYYSGLNPSSGELFCSQFIIPKSSLESSKGRQIKELVFYASRASISFGNAEFEVYLKETDNASYSSSAFESWGTCVFNSATLTVDANMKMKITLDTPFNYTGNNLMIGFKQTVKGTNASSFTWTGVSSTNAGYYYFGTYGNRYSYLPKMTITTIPITTDPVQMGLNGYTTYASPRALDLSKLPSGVKAYKASVNASAGTVSFTEVKQAVPANTGILLEGTASTTYSIPVAESSSEVSGNDFLVNSTGGTFTADDDYTYFGMVKAKSAEDELVFGTFAPGTVAIPSNKAYLKVLTSSLPESGSRLTCVFDEADSVEDVVAGQTQGQTQYYDLQGRQIVNSKSSNRKLTKGLYIVDGRKVAVK